MQMYFMIIEENEAENVFMMLGELFVTFQISFFMITNIFLT